MVSKHTPCEAHVAVKPVGCWHRVQVQCEEMGPQYLSLQISFWFPGRSLEGRAVPGGTRGPPSERLPVAPQPVGH